MGTLLQPVDPIAPVAPVPSILTTARALPGSIDWRSGIQWRPAIKPGSVLTAVDSIVSADDCPEPTDLTADWDPTVLGEALPEFMRLPFECEEVLPGQDDKFRQEALNALTAATAYFVSEYVTATLDAVDTSVADDPIHPATALAVLLANYFDCTRMGGPVVSVPPVLIPTLIGSGTVKQQGEVYYGPMGSVVNPGPFGVWDTNDDVTTGTMFVSGPIEYALGRVNVPLSPREAFWDRTTNLYRIEAQRAFIARHDPDCVFSAQAFLPNPATGEGIA